MEAYFPARGRLNDHILASWREFVVSVSKQEVSLICHRNIVMQ
jgi:hypothetical protein